MISTRTTHAVYPYTYNSKVKPHKLCLRILLAGCFWDFVKKSGQKNLSPIHCLSVKLTCTCTIMIARNCMQVHTITHTHTNKHTRTSVRALTQQTQSSLLLIFGVFIYDKKHKSGIKDTHKMSCSAYRAHNSPSLINFHEFPTICPWLDSAFPSTRCPLFSNHILGEQYKPLPNKHTLLF